MPTRDEIAGWLVELSNWFDSISNMTNMTCTNELNRKRAAMWRERTAAVEQMRCETCDDKDAIIRELVEAIQDAVDLNGNGCIANEDRLDSWEQAIAQARKHLGGEV